MKTAIVYDRVNKWGGAEKVLLALHDIFPDAPLFTSIFHSGKAQWANVFPDVKTSFLQKIPFVKDKHHLIPYLMPVAFESFDFNDYDLVISVTSEAAKGIITGPKTIHVCYCLTPTRYLWSGKDDYFGNKPFRLIASPAVRYLKSWDKIASRRPDKVIAISSAVKERIKKYYGIESEVIFPPVDVESFKPKKDIEKKDYYLVVARLVPYKKTDLVVKTFNELSAPLVIVGKGSDEGRLKRMANKNITFKGFVSEKELVGYYQEARALIFPQEEDFGITAVEAQAAGTPVIAYKKGGALDTVTDGKTGVFFDNQKVNCVCEAVKRFDKMRFISKDLVKNAQRFEKNNFKKQFSDLISKI